MSTSDTTLAVVDFSPGNITSSHLLHKGVRHPPQHCEFCFQSRINFLHYSPAYPLGTGPWSKCDANAVFDLCLLLWTQQPYFLLFKFCFYLDSYQTLQHLSSQIFPRSNSAWLLAKFSDLQNSCLDWLSSIRSCRLFTTCILPLAVIHPGNSGELPHSFFSCLACKYQKDFLPLM